MCQLYYATLAARRAAAISFGLSECTRRDGRHASRPAYRRRRYIYEPPYATEACHASFIGTMPRRQDALAIRGVPRL